MTIDDHVPELYRRGMPKIRTESLRINSALFRKVAARAKAEDQTLVEYVEAAVREKLERSPVTVIVHSKLRKSIRRSKLIPHPGLSRAERRQHEELFNWMLDVAGVPR
ncbi:MAG: hypothetical protein ACREEV_14995 [Dongiaceae bacterium]